jgi:thiol-disulfide isomerase/thioredoxin
MGAALQLGPFVLPGAVLVSAAAAAVTGFTGKRLGGASGRDVETLIWQTLLFGLLVARLAFVWQFRSAYWAAPLDVLDIRDGGWSSEAGFAGAWLYAISKSARKPTLKRPLLRALAAGSAVWLAGSIAMAVLPGKGQPLPEIELATAQGTRVKLSDFKGAPTVVNLWATWCPPCVREMPVLQQAQIDHPSINFVFLNQRESADRVNAWMTARQLALRNVLLDDKAQAAAAFKQTALPTTLFFNANGELLSTRIGELSKATLTERLESLAP